MNQKCTTWATLAASIFVTGITATNSHGQTSDALMNTLIKKGIISEQEAKDIKAEAGKESQNQFNQAFSAKTGMPNWINGYRLYGDLRGRFEENYADNSFYQARERYRYRLRAGLNISMLDNFDVGLRLASGNPLGNLGGSPITASQDLGSLQNRKFLWIDAAYGRWTPIKNNDWTVTATIGKMDNPFQLSNMIWDYDINPEGAALQVNYNLNDHHTLKGIGGAFVLWEFNQFIGVADNPPPANTNASPTAQIHAGHDPYVYGGQLLLESKWTPHIETSLGVAAFNIVHKDSLSDLIQPIYNIGNSRDNLGFLKYNMNPLIGTASATYKFDTSPKTQFPVKVAGEYMKNPAAPSDRNEAYRFGFTLGKAGRKNTWEINYRYQRLEADAWYDAFEDEDNGAFFANGNPQNQGTFNGNTAITPGFVSGGWFGGTNIRGHQVVATYSFTDFLNLTFIYYLNEAIINAPGQTSKAGHFMVDLNWKF